MEHRVKWVTNIENVKGHCFLIFIVSLMFLRNILWQISLVYTIWCVCVNSEEKEKNAPKKLFIQLIKLSIVGIWEKPRCPRTFSFPPTEN